MKFDKIKFNRIWVERLCLMSASIVLGLLVGEAGLRLAGIQGSKKTPLSIDPKTNWYTLEDPYRGWAFRPGASGWWPGEGERSYIQTNSDGLRDREHTIAKPKNTLRIAVLGDSFTEALQVSVEKTFWSKLERKLGRCEALQGRQVEVINFGVQGYGTAQALMTLRHHVWKYSPDIVMLAFFPTNDIVNNSKKLEFYKRQPFFVYNGKDELVEDMSFRKMSIAEHNYLGVSNLDKLPAWLINNSRILQVLRKVDLDNKKRILEKETQAQYVKIFREPDNAEWRDAWKVTEGIISLMATEVKEKQAEFVMAIVSDPMQVHPGRKGRKSFMKDRKISDIFYPNKRLQALGEREGFRVIDLPPQFQQYAENNNICLHGFPNALPCQGHWNAEGHKIASILITQRLCKDLKASQSQPSK